MPRRDVRAPTAAELVETLRAMPDGPKREIAERCYWSLVKAKHGSTRTAWYREEYEWLRKNTRKESR